MRSNRAYSFKEHFSSIRKVVITRLSLWYLCVFSSKKIVIIRDGGLGDCIMSIPLIDCLSKKYNHSRLLLSASFPELFLSYERIEHSFFSFPVIWLSYTSYDFPPWSTRKPLHCSSIMAKCAGLKNFESLRPKIEIVESKHEEFIQKYISGINYMIIQPEAGKWLKEKNWLPQKWAKVVEEMKSKFDRIYQIGTDEDTKISGVIDLRGRTSVMESLLLIQKSSLIISVNSFAEQAAYAFAVPAIILYGPTNPACSLNRGQMAIFATDSVEFEDLDHLDYSFKKMSEIEPKKVIEVAQKKLSCLSNKQI